MKTYLNTALNNIPLALLSAQARETIEQYGEGINDYFGSTLFGFELNLLQSDPVADFSISIKPDKLFKAVEANPANFRSLFPAHKDEKLLDGFERHLASYPAADLIPYPLLDLFCFEYDFQPGGNTLPAPGIFIGLTPYRRPIETEIKRYEERTALTPQQTINSIELILQREVEQEIRNGLEKAMTSLSGEGYIYQFGFMLSRPVNAVRLCLRAESLDWYLDYLHRLDWPGDTAEVKELLADFDDLFDRPSLDIDITPNGIRGRIGIEFIFDGKPSPPKEKRWHTAIDLIKEKNIALAEKADALTDVPRKISLFPFSFYTGIEELTAAKESYTYLARGLHHLKVVIEPGKQPYAKTYFWTAYA